jgi:hypothetical protein
MRPNALNHKKPFRIRVVPLYHAPDLDNLIIFGTDPFDFRFIFIKKAHPVRVTQADHPISNSYRNHYRDGITIKIDKKQLITV